MLPGRRDEELAQRRKNRVAAHEVEHLRPAEYGETVSFPEVEEPRRLVNFSTRQYYRHERRGESMATTTKAADQRAATLEIRRLVPAARERVFDAWTQAKELDRWSAPAPMTPRAEVDLRVGGRYRIVMRDPDGVERSVGGVYRVIERPSKKSSATLDKGQGPRHPFMESWMTLRSLRRLYSCL